MGWVTQVGPDRVRFRVSEGMQTFCVIAVVICGLTTFLTGLLHPDELHDVVGAGAVSWVFLIAIILMRGGWIEVGSDGIRARNILLSYEWGWDDVLRIDAAMNVEVVERDGTRRVLWAVQRAQAALYTGRRSRVDDVVDHLERCRVFYQGHRSGEQLTARRGVVRLRAWEIVVTAALVPGLTIAGLVLGGS